MRSIVVFAALALTASIVVPRYAAQTSSAKSAPSIMLGQPAASNVASSNNSRSVIVPPDGHGHFHVEGRVEGRRLSFMVDTGASTVALSARDAAMLGIHPAEHDFTVRVNTANGVARAAPVRLNLIEIDDIMVHDVVALVMSDGALGENLLGMSFLSRLRRFEISGGKLEMEQ
jgi:aspartyl protease family protein